MGELFPNQYYGINILKHEELPIIKTHDFNFFRCVEFNENFYGETISKLHGGNIRISRTDNRYSSLFPGQKLSYWADSPATARAEVKKWGASNNLLTFWAYDDASSFVPTVYPAEYLKIVDGIHFGFNRILKKVEKNIKLTNDEQNFIERIAHEEPDCLAYFSEARMNGICFLFFEQGFKKLALRKVSLRLGDYPGKNKASVQCAITSDFTPVLKKYGNYFMPIARVKYDKNYVETDEYILRKQAESRSYQYIKEHYSE